MTAPLDSALPSSDAAGAREARVLELAAKKIEDMAADAVRRGHDGTARAHRRHVQELREIAARLTAPLHGQPAVSVPNAGGSAPAAREEDLARDGTFFAALRTYGQHLSFCPRFRSPLIVKTDCFCGLDTAIDAARAAASAPEEPNR